MLIKLAAHFSQDIVPSFSKRKQRWFLHSRLLFVHTPNDFKWNQPSFWHSFLTWWKHVQSLPVLSQFQGLSISRLGGGRSICSRQDTLLTGYLRRKIPGFSGAYESQPHIPSCKAEIRITKDAGNGHRIDQFEPIEPDQKARQRWRQLTRGFWVVFTEAFVDVGILNLMTIVCHAFFQAHFSCRSWNGCPCEASCSLEAETSHVTLALQAEHPLWLLRSPPNSWPALEGPENTDRELWQQAPSWNLWQVMRKPKILSMFDD